MRIVATVMMVTVMAGSGCTGANRAALVTSTVALACDWAQTRRVAQRGWTAANATPRGPTWEDNPIMGKYPSTGAVDLYFVYAVAANAALYALTPDRYKAAAPAALTAFEVNTIAGNAPNTGICGL